jgi:hypothetical protein
MHPAGAAAGGAVRAVRAVARANIILGLAMAAIALVAATMFNPGDFHAQVRHVRTVTNSKSSTSLRRFFTGQSTILI